MTPVDPGKEEKIRIQQSLNKTLGPCLHVAETQIQKTVGFLGAVEGRREAESMLHFLSFVRCFTDLDSFHLCHLLKGIIV